MDLLARNTRRKAEVGAIERLDRGEAGDPGEHVAGAGPAREMFARVAGFPTIKTLGGFDFSFATGVPRQQIHELARLAFILLAFMTHTGPLCGSRHLGRPVAERFRRC